MCSPLKWLGLPHAKADTPLRRLSLILTVIGRGDVFRRRLVRDGDGLVNNDWHFHLCRLLGSRGSHYRLKRVKLGQGPMALI